MLLKNYITTALRNISKQKIYSFVNIIGLSIGIAVSIIITLYVLHELSFDKHHENSKDIYRIVRSKNNESGYICTPPPLSNTLKQNVPEVKAICRILPTPDLLVKFNDNKFVEKNIYWVDKSILDVFTISLKYGKKKMVFNNPQNIIISEKIAVKFFGTENPLGKTLTLHNKFEFIVSGVYNDFPAASHFKMDFIIPIESYFKISGNDESKWSSNYCYTYLKLHPNAKIDLIEDKLSQIEKEYWPGYSNDNPQRILFLQPITKIHLFSHRRQEINPNNSIKSVISISFIGLLILIIAIINYINLANAKSVERYKEVSLRKVFGGKRIQLLLQFLGESVLITLISTIVAFIIVQLVLPYFNQFMERQIHLGIFKSPVVIILSLFLSIIIGILAGILPARIISRTNPIATLKGAKVFNNNKSRFSAKNFIVIFQYTAAIILIVLTFISAEQLNFIRKKDVGYNKKDIVVIKNIGNDFRKNYELIKTELLKYSEIDNVSTSNYLPNNVQGFTRPEWFLDHSGESLPIFYNEIGYNFLELYDIEILNGRAFSEDFSNDQNGAFIVNEEAVKLAGWKQPIGEKVDHWSGEKGEIIGVMKNFNSQSLHSDIEPLYFFLNPKIYSTVSIKLNPRANTNEILKKIEDIYLKYSPNYPFDYDFFENIFEQSYKADIKQAKSFIYFSFLSLFLTSLGLWGLSTYIVNKRTKELAIRKVLGAPVNNLIFVISKAYIYCLAIAILLAFPTAYFLSHKFLQQYAYRINIKPLIFILSIVLILLVSIITIIWKSIKVIKKSPVDSLMCE